MSIKVLWLTNLPSPYRVDFFNKLGVLCDLTVLYERSTDKDREDSWLKSTALNFHAIFLKNIKVRNSVICYQIKDYLKSNDYDIFINGSYSTFTGVFMSLLLKKSKKDFIITVDGGFVKNENKIKYMIKKKLLGAASAWLSTGKKTSEYLVHYGADENKIYEYPFSSISDTDIIQSIICKQDKKNIRKDLGIEEDKVVLTIGQFIYRKGFDVLIKAAKSINSDAGMYFIGGTPSKQYLDLVSEYNLKNIHFIDFKSKEELKQFYLASDVFVLPTREDIWGLVINEAMAYGLPIITTDKCIAGVELINDFENGFVIPVNEYNLLANKINFILDNEELQESMSINNLSKIGDFTIEEMAETHYRIFCHIKKNGFW